MLVLKKKLINNEFFNILKIKAKKKKKISLNK